MKEWNVKKLLLQMIGVIMARAPFVGINPIGAAYFAAVFMDKKGRVLSMLGVSLGMISAMPRIEAIKYIIVMIVISIITSLIEYNSKRVSILVIGALTGTVTAIMSIANGLMNQGEQHYVLIAIAEGVTIFAFSFIFRKGIEPILHGMKGQAFDNEQIISMAIILGVIIYGVPSPDILGFSLSLAVSLFSVLLVGYKYGAGYGAVAGTACGIILALKTGQMNQIGMMCMLGIVSGTFREMGRFFTAAMYSTAVMVLGEIYRNYRLDLSGLGALVTSAIIFLLLPKKITYKVNSESEEEDEGDVFVHQSIQNIAKGKLKDFSESFQNLSDTFASIADKKTELSNKDKSDIFNEVSETLCKDCNNCSICWKSNFSETYEGAYHILDIVDKTGTISIEEVPKNFAERCIYLDTFMFETRRMLEIAKLNLVWYNRMAESREAIAGQLCEVANIIDDFSMELYKTVETSETKKKRMIYDLRANYIIVKRIAIFEKRNDKQEIYMTARTERGRCFTTKEAAGIISNIFGKRMRPADGCKNVMTKDYETFVFVEDADYRVFTGMARMTKEGGRISGDNFSFIYPDPGTVVMTLSDGMGSGEAACEESESVVELLEQFIEAGFRKESAVKLINSILVLKTEEQTFSTIDMSVINLFTGECDFIKIGASTTFIKRSSWVEVINSTSLPVGVFNQVDYETVSRRLYDGDYVIMVTDGVIDCIPGDEKEKFLEEFILDLRMNHPKEIANAVLNQALELNQWVPKDDMTVLVAGFLKK